MISSQQTATKFINVNSSLRSSGASSDLVCQLDHTIEMATKVTLSHFSCYNTFYNVTSENNSFKFTDSVGTFTVLLYPGNWVSSDIVSTIQADMNVDSSGYQLSYDKNTMKITFSNASAFSLDFTKGGAGSLLGFESQVYNSSGANITAPNVMDLGQPGQIFIYIDELQSSFVGSAGSFQRPTFVITVDSDREMMLIYNQNSHWDQFVEMATPVNISRLSVKLLTPSAIPGQPPVPLHLNGSEYQLILRVEHQSYY